MPAEAAITKTFTSWAKRIEDETGGRVKITCYLGGSLLSHPELLRGVQEGVADVAWYAPSEDAGMWDLVSFYDLAFLGFKSNKQAAVIYNELLKNKALGLRDEFDNKGLIPYGCMFPPPFQLFTTKTPVRAPADIKGMKCYALGETSKVIAAAGGAPVTMEITDVYMALDRGLIEGVCTHFAAMMVFGLLDFAKYATIFGDGGCYDFMNCFIINAKTWNGLPPDIQKVFSDLESWQANEEYTASQSEVDAAVGICKDKNVSFLELTPEEIAAWEALAQPSHDDWLAKMEAKGKGEQAKALWDELKRLIAETPK
jgi:TRAP-type C4-dicarboxylate transport system substrate-binding protein